MRRIPVLSVALVAAAIAVAACGGTPAASSLPTVPPINVPSGAIPSIAVPSISIPSTNISSIPPLGSFAIPSFDTNGDPALAARFPTTINGSPVTVGSTVNFLQFYQAFAGISPSAQANFQQFVSILQNNGIDPTTLAFGIASVDINDNTEQIEAFHTPGASAAALLTVFPQLAALQNANETPPTIASANIGGKAVTTVDDGSGSIDYLYPSGDVLWDISTDSSVNAALILAALQ